MTIVRSEYVRTKGIDSRLYLTEEEENALHITKRIMESIEGELERIGKTDATINAAIHALEMAEEDIEYIGFYLVK